MRILFPVFIFLFAATLPAFGQAYDPETAIAAPVNFKTTAIEQTLEYGKELRQRHDYVRAAQLYKHLLKLDPCNLLARADLSSIAEAGYNSKDIKAYIDGLKCTVPPPSAPVAVAPAVRLDYVPEVRKPVATFGTASASPVTPKSTAPVTGTPKSAPAKIVDVGPMKQAPTAAKAATIQVNEATPTTMKIETAPVVVTAPPQFQKKTLQEKLADLEGRLQRAEITAQNQNNRLNRLNNEEPLTRN